MFSVTTVNSFPQASFAALSKGDPTAFSKVQMRASPTACKIIATFRTKALEPKL